MINTKQTRRAIIVLALLGALVFLSIFYKPRPVIAVDTSELNTSLSGNGVSEIIDYAAQYFEQQRIEAMNATIAAQEAQAIAEEAMRPDGVVSLDGCVPAKLETAVVTETIGGDGGDPWSNRLMTTSSDYLRVRTEASKESALAGKLRKGDAAEIVEIGEEWTLIKSGNLEGYVYNEYCVMGQDARALAEKICKTYAFAQSNGLRVREGPGTDYGIIKTVPKGAKLVVDKTVDNTGDWVKVKLGLNEAYVAHEYVTIEQKVGTGITVQEEAEIEAEKQRAAALGIASRSTDEELLLAALIQCEAGNQPYEGMVSVGAVVMNRVYSSRYPNNMYDVIHQRGQFTPALNGKVARQIAVGVKSSCKQAAIDAIDGMDYTGGALHFKQTRSGIPGLVIGGHVFY